MIKCQSCDTMTPLDHNDTIKSLLKNSIAFEVDFSYTTESALANGNDVNFNSFFFFCGKRSDQIIQHLEIFSDKITTNEAFF